MSDTDLLKSRIRPVAKGSGDGKCVIYVMSRDQRVRDNHVLAAAQKHALAKKLPLAVVFCLYDKVGVRAREHYQFMIDGLRQVEADLAKLDIPFMMLIGNPKERLTGLMHHTQPDAMYFDFNPLRGSRKLVDSIADGGPAVYVVDTHNLVPMWVVSDKEEFGAYTIRPKIHKLFATYLVEPEQAQKHPHAWPGVVQSMDALNDQIDQVVAAQPSNGTKLEWKPGEEPAADHLQQFIDTKLKSYAVDRNDPSSGSQSDLSPYLHFGQLSSLRVSLELQKKAAELGTELHFLHSPKMPKPEEAELTASDGIDSLIEEMIVRKELADNYCYYNAYYDTLDAARDWALKTLDEHRADPREYLYIKEQLEQAQTHDRAWNAAQTQLTRTGKMHGYMRMYWAKKVLEWTESPEQAIEILVYLNDHYSIDGGDPNGYAGILWSVAGVHDRSWAERDVFGKIRHMNYGGLKRKFDIEAYEKQWLK